MGLHCFLPKSSMWAPQKFRPLMGHQVTLTKQGG